MSDYKPSIPDNDWCKDSLESAKQRNLRLTWFSSHIDIIYKNETLTSVSYKDIIRGTSNVLAGIGINILLYLIINSFVNSLGASELLGNPLTFNPILLLVLIGIDLIAIAIAVYNWVGTK